MARLNEVPVPVESVDALKRRFLRQNRELAKTNSTQSVRIRCLEAEVSRLLTENLRLREEILQWRNNVERGPDRYAIGAVKNEFQIKIQELGKLVADLGLLTQSQPQEKGERREPTVGWGRGANVELGDGSDGRLPGIQEDRAWGRKTLDNGEILEMAENTESPDLGPPPVAHFQDEDPIKFEAQPTIIAPAPELGNQCDDLPAALSVNLETRRKKRDSQGKLNIRRMSVFHSPPERFEDESATGTKAISGTLPIRAGAKRKMSARDDEGKGETKASEEFTFSRKANVVAFEDPAKVDKERDVKEDGKARSKREQVTIQAPERRALGNKPVNTDPVVSPKKSAVRSKISDEKPHLKKSSEPNPKEAPRPRSRQAVKPAAEKPLIISIPPTRVSAPKVAEIQTTSFLPKTPAAPADLFSPATTAPSTSRVQAGRDTPPPGDLGANGDANGGRAGRRARVSVNYAEPSLNSKMRRPSAQLVDAVDCRGRPVAGIMVPSAAAREKSLMGSVIKTEPRNDDAWKALPVAAGEPASPLSKKSTGNVPLKDISGNGMEVREEIPVQSAAAAAISTLIQSNKERRKSQLGLATETTTRLEKKEENSGRDSLGVFDFVSSSPPRDHLSTKTTERTRTASRRHSSMSGTSSALTMKDRHMDGDSRPGSRGHKRQTSASAAVTRDLAPPTTTESEDEGNGLARSQRASRRSSMVV